MSKPEPMHNRITSADDNKSPPVFCQTPCCVLLWDSLRSKLIIKRNARCIIFCAAEPLKNILLWQSSLM